MAELKEDFSGIEIGKRELELMTVEAKKFATSIYEDVGTQRSIDMD